MSLHRSLQPSPRTHQSLLERMPRVTGYDLAHWLNCLNEGPGLLRFSERVSWLRDMYSLPHCYAAAVVHEAARRRRALRA